MMEVGSMATDKIEEAFQTTTKIVLGRTLTNLPDYREWLFQYVGCAIRMKSEVSDKTVYVPNTLFYTSIKKNMVTLDESVGLGEKHLTMEEIKKLGITNASEKLKDIKYVTSDVIIGENIDVRESAAYMNAQYCLEGVFYIYSRYDAYCFWPRETEYSFGCFLLFASKFCIKCYNSVSLTRCFEVSDSNSCVDCYFCHNCESLSDCMFCFNVKAKRYAIGNVEVGRERYLGIKQRLINEIAEKIEKDKRLDLNIYNFGCKRNR